MGDLWQQNFAIITKVTAGYFGLLMLISVLSMIAVSWRLLRRLVRRRAPAAEKPFLPSEAAMRQSQAVPPLFPRK